MEYKLQKIKAGLIYVNALNTKMNDIETIRNKIKKSMINKIIEIGILNNGMPFHLSDKLKPVVDEEKILLENAITISNTFFDILLQLINSEILKNTYSECDVKYTNIWNKITNLYPDLSNAIEGYKKSSEMQYVSAYTNTVKHRGYIAKKCVLSSKDISGPVICSFNRNNTLYEEQNWNDIFIKIDRLFTLANQIIYAIDQQI